MCDKNNDIFEHRPETNGKMEISANFLCGISSISINKYRKKIYLLNH